MERFAVENSSGLAPLDRVGWLADQPAEFRTTKVSSPLLDRATLDTFSVVAALVGLYAVLRLGLLPALLSGLLIAQLVHGAVPVLYRLGIANRNLGRAIALTLVTTVVATLISLLIVAVASRLTAGPENLFFLMQSMAEVIDTARTHLPAWASPFSL